MCVIESGLNLVGKARRMAWNSFSMLVCLTTRSWLFGLPGITTTDESFLPLKIKNQPAKQKDVLGKKKYFQMYRKR